MIELYTGTPGSGKSLHAAHEIRMALTKPRGADQPVIANFDVNLTDVKRPNAFHYVPNEELTPDFITSFADDFWSNVDRPFEEDYILVVLDEVQLIFNSRDWQSKGRQGRNDSRMDWLAFLSQHRKYGIKVILIAQSAKMIDNQFRMLVEYEINHRKVSNMGIGGAIIGALFRNRLFCMVKNLFYTNENLGVRFVIGKTKDMSMYDSYAKLRQQTE